jgi:hypothetical protein
MYHRAKGTEMNENGMKWARAGLIGGVIASVTGNVANACLTETTVSLALRIPLAVIWPVGLFIAVEVLVRNRHVRGWLARLGQGALLSVTVPTAITSFGNLHALMVMAAEPGVAQLTGPLAIDGLMLGCTIMMLAARIPAMAADIRAVSTDAADIDGWMADIEAEHKAVSARGVDVRPDADLFARLSAEMTADGLDVSTPAAASAVMPVSPAGPRADTIPSDAVDLFQAWASTDVQERPAAGQMVTAMATYFGRDARTIRRWRAAALAA